MAAQILSVCALYSVSLPPDVAVWAMEKSSDLRRSRVSPFAESAPELHCMGYSPVPIIPGKQSPGIKPNGHWYDMREWTRYCDTSPTEAEINRWSKFDKAGVGIALGNGVVAVDIDTDDPMIIATIEAVLPPARVRKRGQKGYTAFFRDPSKKIRTRRLRSRERGMICEVLAAGAQTVIPPSIHPRTNESYRYLTDATLQNTHALELPEIPIDLGDRIECAIAPWLEKKTADQQIPRRCGRGETPGNDRMRPWAGKALIGEAEKLAGMQPDSGRNIQLFSAACTLGKYVHHDVLEEQDVCDVLLDACERCGLRNGDGQQQCVATIKSGIARASEDSLPNLDDYASIFEAARETDQHCGDGNEEKSGENQARSNPDDTLEQFAPPIWFEDVKLDLQDDWLIKNVLARGDLGVVVGEPKAGKTFFVVDLVYHIALGRAWQGRKVRRGGVLYLCLEGWRGFQNRMIAQRLRSRADVDANSRPIPIALWSAPLDLCHSLEHTDLLIAEVHKLSSVAETPISLIVIDTLARTMGSGDENSSADMGALLRHVSKIQQKTKAHVLLVHHLGKDSSRGPRGHSSLTGAADTVFEVKRKKDSDVCTSTLTKQKDGEDGLPFGFRLEQVNLGDDDDGDPITTCVVEYTDQTIHSGSKTLAPQQARALEILRNTIADSGETAPCNLVDIPKNTEVVTVDQWREACRTGGLTHSMESAAFRKAFTRTHKALVEKEYINEASNLVWLPVPVGPVPNERCDVRDDA